MKLQHEGKFTSGYYNDMEAGYPVFINYVSLSHVVKRLLAEQDFDSNFCYEPGEEHEDVDNPLIGKKVRLTLEIEMEGDEIRS